MAPFKRSGARYVPQATVWSIDRRDDGTFAVAISAGPPHARHTLTVESRAVILATGALERPFPIPGWTLPGVFMAGAAQILLKTAGIIPGGQRCSPVADLCCGSSRLSCCAPGRRSMRCSTRRRAAGSGGRSRTRRRFCCRRISARGRELVRTVRRRVRVVEYVTSLAVDGAAAATAIRFGVDGQRHSLPVDQVLLHQGVVPDINLAGAAGCALAWNDLQACFAPVVDAWGGTTVPGLYVAGDGAGIAGALAAEARGRLTALGVANALGRIDSDARERDAQRYRRDHAMAARGRLFLDTLYRPADAFRIPEGDTLACRCEEVSAATLTQLARGGCAGPNQMKALARCGMGACQGRWCGLTVTELIAHAQRRDPAEVGYYRLRFPTKPVPLSDLVALSSTPEAEDSVLRLPR